MESLADLQFLRPLWFIAAAPWVLFMVLLWRARGRENSWQKAISPELLPQLLEETPGGTNRLPLMMISLAGLLAIVALAGPVWKKMPQPVHEREDALIILFDLSRSMLAEDAKPNRLIRARRKLLDLLKRREEGITGLIVYAGDAHTVSPLTDDAHTIASLIPAISPDIMPAQGSRLAPAIALAQNLFVNAGVESGQLLVITDEIRDASAVKGIVNELGNAYPLAILSVGTEEGAPVPLYSLSPRGGFLKDDKGVLVIPKVNPEGFRDLAASLNARYTRMSLTDQDLDYLLSDQSLLPEDAYRAIERDFDVWQEEGPWLVLLLVPFVLLAFRRGWLWIVLLGVSINTLTPRQAEASLWDDLWQTRDQQGDAALKAGNAAEAAELFDDPEWQAAARYRSENFESAAEYYKAQQDFDDHYNLGNSLARLGKLEEAIAAYENALSINPDDEDAIFNKKLVEDLLEEQEDSQENQEKNDQDQSDKKDDSDQQEEQQQNSEENNPESDEQQQDDQQTDTEEPPDEEEKESDDQSEEKEEDQKNESEQQNEPTEQSMADPNDSPMDSEEEQALQQWLQRVPDDPGGLLRKKFRIQYEEKRRKQNVQEDADESW